MGILNLFGKREKEAPKDETLDDGDEWVTVKVRKSELEEFNRMMKFSKLFGESPEGQDWSRKHEEDQRRIEAEIAEQQERRKEALAERGVDTSLITLDKGRADMFNIAKTLCGVDLAELGACEREVVTWQQLTKTGNVPKCVATYSTHWSLWSEEGFNGGSVACEVGYLADGTPYTAWVSDLRGSGTYYKVKTVDGKLTLVAANPA